MNINQTYYYTALISASNCIIDARINDVPLLKQILDCDLCIEIPINFLIEKSGFQSLSINTLPEADSNKFPDDAKCRIEIWKYNVVNGNEIKPLEKVCESHFSANQNNIVQSVFHDRKEFFASVGYQISRWSDCNQLTDRNVISSHIASIFQNIGDLLTLKKYNEYVELIRNREQNICTALMTGSKEIQLRSNMLIDCLDDGFVMVPINGRKVLQFYANRRIVTLLDQDMKSALRFYNDKTGEMLAIDILLGIKYGKTDFEII